MTYPPPPPPGDPFPPPVDPYEPPHHTEVNLGQPGYGQQPPYGHPGYGQQVGYGHPGYGQAPHGHVPHGQPPYPAVLPPPAPPGSRTVAITLVSVAIALVVLVGGGVVFYLIGSHLPAGTEAGSPRSKGPTAGPSPSPTPSAVDEEIRISEPDTLNGQPKIEAEETEQLTSDLEEVLEGYPGADNAFSAVYGSPGGKDLVIALAAEADIDDQQHMLDTIFQSFSGESQLTGVTPASTGSLGGVVQCGSTVIDKEDVAICGWVDEGSVGMILYYDKTAVDVKGDFPDMRAEIETRE